MAKDGYETFTVTWENRSIEVSYKANWLNTGYWHIELRSDDPLPVTSTGYRSAFVAAESIESAEAVESYVLEWLDHAAEDKTWKIQVQNSRQLDLF